MAEPVRLVIWDLDETFWGGTLTEGGIEWRETCAQIVIELARRGIMSSICSKNDFETVKALLVDRGVWDYFIFPSIDWAPKGPRIAQLVETTQLRAPTILLIDDNHLNLEEAKFFAPGLQTASDAIIPSLLSDPRLQGKDDAALSRLNQYKVLERRKADEARERAATCGDNVAFLRASDIRVQIIDDVEAHLDRAIELINRTNQLNFTKLRLPEDIEAARDQLKKDLAHFSNQAGLIAVSDRYGDYGICGYFQVSTRRDVADLRHFCFSCRILDMGVEAWVYQRLGRPGLEVAGEVLSDPVGAAIVDWIRPGAHDAPDVVDAEPPLGSVAARGGCILWPLVHYFRLSAETVVGEFNTIRDGLLIKLDHAICLRNAMRPVTAEQLAAVSPLGFVAEDFRTDFFTHTGEKPIWIFSCWTDMNRQVYRHRRTGLVIPYEEPRTDRQRAVLAAAKDHLEAEFTQDEMGDEEFKETLAAILANIPRHGLLFLLLIAESARGPDGRLTQRSPRRRLNRLCAEVAAGRDNVRLLRVTDFVHDDTEVLNPQFTHFDRRVYHRLYLHVMEAARADLAASRERRIA